MLREIDPPFPEIAELAGLTHLHVVCHEEEAFSLENFHNLKELTFKNAAVLQQQLVISSSANITQLSVGSRLVRSRHVKHPHIIFPPHKSDHLR